MVVPGLEDLGGAVVVEDIRSHAAVDVGGLVPTGFRGSLGKQHPIDRSAFSVSVLSTIAGIAQSGNKLTPWPQCASLLPLLVLSP